MNINFVMIYVVYCGHFYNRIYEAGSENNTAVVAVETHTIHKIEEGIGKSFCCSSTFFFFNLTWRHWKPSAVEAQSCNHWTPREALF